MKTLYVTGDTGAYALFRSTLGPKAERRPTKRTTVNGPPVEITAPDGAVLVKVSDVTDEEAAALASSTLVRVATRKQMTVSRKRNANPVVSLRMATDGYPIACIDLPKTERRPQAIAIAMPLADHVAQAIWLKPTAARAFLVATGITDRRADPAVARDA